MVYAEESPGDDAEVDMTTLAKAPAEDSSWMRENVVARSADIYGRKGGEYTIEDIIRGAEVIKKYISNGDVPEESS